MYISPVSIQLLIKKLYIHFVYDFQLSMTENSFSSTQVTTLNGATSLCISAAKSHPVQHAQVSKSVVSNPIPRVILSKIIIIIIIIILKSLP